MARKLLKAVYCRYDGYLVFKYEGGVIRCEPICDHPELKGNVPEVDYFSYEYVSYCC